MSQLHDVGDSGAGGRAARPGGHVERRIAAWACGAAGLDGLTKLVALLLARTRIGGPIADVHNPGLSMSIGPARSPFLAWLALLVLVLFGGWVVARARRGSVPAWIPGLLIGGAGANLADRVLFGAVHDWLRLGPVVLNLADVTVLAAAIGMLVYFLQDQPLRSRRAPPAVRSNVIGVTDT